jgi:hypothetical protein
MWPNNIVIFIVPAVVAVALIGVALLFSHYGKD